MTRLEHIAEFLYTVLFKSNIVSVVFLQDLFEVFFNLVSFPYAFMLNFLIFLYKESELKSLHFISHMQEIENIFSRDKGFILSKAIVRGECMDMNSCGNKPKCCFPPIATYQHN